MCVNWQETRYIYSHKRGQKHFIYLVNNVLNKNIKVFEIINNPAKLVEDNQI